MKFLFLAIISRESAWGLALTPPNSPAGTGDHRPRPRTTPRRSTPLPPDGGGFGRGLGQIDYDAHEFARNGNWKDATENLTFGYDLLVTNYNRIKHEFPKLREPILLFYTAGSYNCGLGKALNDLRERRSVDFSTAHQDYASDIMQLSGWWKAMTDGQ